MKIVNNFLFTDGPEHVTFAVLQLGVAQLGSAHASGA
jgi:hypothetical protein